MRKKENAVLYIVVPCYNEEESLELFYKEFNKCIKKIKNINYELIFVNDGSKDKTLEFILKLSNKNKNIKYISFSRNFGKESAMYAGLKNSIGDFVAIMDAD